MRLSFAQIIWNNKHTRCFTGYSPHPTFYSRTAIFLIKRLTYAHNRGLIITKIEAPPRKKKLAYQPADGKLEQTNTHIAAYYFAGRNYFHPLSIEREKCAFMAPGESRRLSSTSAYRFIYLKQRALASHHFFDVCTKRPAIVSCTCSRCSP